MPRSSETVAAVREVMVEARSAARTLAGLSGSERRRLVEGLAGALQDRAQDIAAANAVDLSQAERLVADGDLQPAALQRLAFDETKVRAVADGVRKVAALPDPVGRVTLATELDDRLVLERVSCPIGVLAVIFESRPDAFPQIVALALKTGNAVILKGGREAERSNRAIAGAVQEALAASGVPAAAVALVEGREAVKVLLTGEDAIDLIIPRGSADLVRYIQANTRIPVLGHADGLCHMYVDRDADLEQAVALAVDSKAQYPSACNAIETLLVHADVAAAYLPHAMRALRAEAVALRGDPRACALVGGEMSAAAPEDWDTEHGALTLNVAVVDSLDAALAHIARHGSRHTEAIVTENTRTARRFCDEVDAGGVFVNASTRFADGYRYGFGAEVGISTGKLHPRGPVGMDGLVTYKYRVTGAGHVVRDYVGPGAKPFAHRELDPTPEEAAGPLG